MLMKVKTHVDFNVVEPHHQSIDKRLVNWGRYCFSRRGSGATGIFKFVKPSQQWDAIETTIPIDHHDAIKIAKGVAALPKPHAQALNWQYVSRTSPHKGCRLLATNMDGLSQLIRDGRTMLINRAV